MGMADLFAYTFFQYATLGCFLASVVCGIVGTYIVTKRMIFISGGITHSSLGGVGMGLYFGFPPIVGAALFSMFSALGIEWLGRRAGVREDSAIAMFWTFGMAVGIMFSYLTPGYVPDLSVYLFGNVMTIESLDLLFLAVLAAVVVFTQLCFGRLTLAVAFDEEYARSLRLPVSAFKYLMAVFISLSVVACIRIAGIVLTLSLLTVPIMTAMLFTKSYSRIAVLSVAISFVTCMGGLMLAYYANIPSGTSIIFLSVLLYALLRTAAMLLRKGNKKRDSLFFK